MKKSKINPAAGFSLVELLIILVLVGILSSIALLSLNAGKLYEADKQAIEITDLLQEARQRSLSQRNTLRIEINQTKNSIRLIDEVKPGDASDDVVVKSVAYMNNGVYIGTAPSNMSNGGPTELSPVLPISFTTSTHPLSIGDQVSTIRFRKGNAQNAGSDAIGTNSIPTGATIYVWSKFADDNSPNPTVAQVVRAVTVLGSTGSSRLWKCSFTGSQCTDWNN